MAKALGVHSDTIGRHIKVGCEAGLLDKVTIRRTGEEVDTDTGEILTRRFRQACFRLEGTLEDALLQVADFEVSEGEDLRLSRDARCRHHPDTPVKRTTRARCPECERLVSGAQ